MIPHISNQKHPDLAEQHLKSYDTIFMVHHRSKIRRWFYAALISSFFMLFLPWTQNIRAPGAVTTLMQEHRPQDIPTIIPGRVLKWHVREGDIVRQGDTIVQLAEIKDDYLDPNLVARTREQLEAKRMSVESYRSKSGTAGQQIAALREAMDLKMLDMANKIRQQQLKIRSDSMDLLAAGNDLEIKTAQYRRQRVMYDSGVVSLVQLEQRNQAYQESMAKRTSAEIKLTNTRQEYLRLQLERNGELQQYLEKISKAEGDRYQALSQVQTGTGEIAKLENQVTNYTIRNGLYTVLAPQDGQVVKAKKAGIGEILKEGEMIAEIVPTRVDYAIEMFVRPVDLPLLRIGQKVRLLFDGFPAIVFSGWPAASYGTFGGEVAAIESNVSANGKFRILIREATGEKPWPRQLMMGTGAKGIALLKDVPVWYELWRNINGFPPDFYQTPEKEKSKGK